MGCFSLSFLVLVLLPYSKPFKGSPLSSLAALSQTSAAGSWSHFQLLLASHREKCCLLFSLFMPLRQHEEPLQASYNCALCQDEFLEGWGHSWFPLILAKALCPRWEAMWNYFQMNTWINTARSLHAFVIPGPPQLSFFVQFSVWNALTCPSLGFLNFICSHPEWTAEYEKWQRQY